jgi:hypothetical protein
LKNTLIRIGSQGENLWQFGVSKNDIVRATLKTYQIVRIYSRNGSYFKAFWSGKFSNFITDSERGAYSGLTKSPGHSTWALISAFKLHKWGFLCFRTCGINQTLLKYSLIIVHQGGYTHVKKLLQINL